MNFPGIDDVETPLEQHFQRTEPLGAHSVDVFLTVNTLVLEPPEKGFPSHCQDVAMTLVGTSHVGLMATLTDTGFLPCCQVMLDQSVGQRTSNSSVRPANDTEHPSYFSVLAAQVVLLFP